MSASAAPVKVAMGELVAPDAVALPVAAPAELDAVARTTGLGIEAVLDDAAVDAAEEEDCAAGAAAAEDEEAESDAPPVRSPRLTPAWAQSWAEMVRVSVGGRS